MELIHNPFITRWYIPMECSMDLIRKSIDNILLMNKVQFAE